jgi:hypothetical protein
MPICTPHARARMQQRGIRAEALEALLEAGTASPVSNGREIVFFDKVGRDRLGRKAPRTLHGRDRLQRLYAIMDAHGTVITAGHRYRRIARKH